MPQKGPVLSGGCYCGAVTFETTAPSKWCAHCHCSICRRIHGSGVVTWLGFEQDAVLLHDSSGELYWYESTPGARRGSCHHCGSQMFFMSERFPGELHIVRAAFTGDVDREPEGHAHEADSVNWLSLAGGPGEAGNSS